MRNQAKTLEDKILYIHSSQLRDTTAGKYFIKDLIDLEVYTQQGELLGVLTDVLELPAHDVYQVNNGKREILIPAISSVILEVQLDQRRMVVQLPDGLEELD